MARRSDVIAQLVRYSVRYGPLAYEGFRRTRGPAGQLAQQAMSRRTARMLAMEHAAHLVDGSVLPVYDGDTRVWVVFSGDEPVGTHPVVRTPIETLLQHYDLTKRTRPAAAGGESMPRLAPTAALDALPTDDPTGPTGPGRPDAADAPTGAAGGLRRRPTLPRRRRAGRAPAAAPRRIQPSPAGPAPDEDLAP